MDASELAFAASVFIKSWHKESTCVRLLTAKAHVAPKHALSIPRMELDAAVLGTKLTDTVTKELRLPVKRCVFWSDSRTVLAWIQSSHRRYNIFVAHRIGLILTFTSMDQWRWVPSKENPADEATKPIDKNSIWLDGPAFLRKTEEDWPKPEKFSTTDEVREFVGIHIAPTDSTI